MRIPRLLLFIGVSTIALAVAALVFAGGGDGDAAEDSASSYHRLEDLTAASDLVVEAVVESVAEGRLTPAPEEDPDILGTQHLDVTLRVEDVPRGAVALGDRIVVSWIGWEVEADGSRGDRVLSGGQPVPEVGDHDVWFLFDWQTGVYGLSALEGRLEVVGGELRARLDDPGGLAGELDELSYAELRDRVTAVAS